MTPDPHFTAGAIRFAALAFAASESEAQRRFAPTLETWTLNAERRAAPEQGDLFAQTIKGQSNG